MISISAFQPINVDLFPHTSEECKMVLTCSLMRESEKIHSRHRDEPIVSCGDVRIDNKGERVSAHRVSEKA